MPADRMEQWPATDASCRKTIETKQANELKRVMRSKEEELGVDRLQNKGGKAIGTDKRRSILALISFLLRPHLSLSRIQAPWPSCAFKPA